MPSSPRSHGQFSSIGHSLPSASLVRAPRRRALSSMDPLVYLVRSCRECCPPACQQEGAQDYNMAGYRIGDEPRVRKEPSARLIVPMQPRGRFFGGGSRLAHPHKRHHNRVESPPAKASIPPAHVDRPFPRIAPRGRVVRNDRIHNASCVHDASSSPILSTCSHNRIGIPKVRALLTCQRTG